LLITEILPSAFTLTLYNRVSKGIANTSASSKKKSEASLPNSGGSVHSYSAEEMEEKTSTKESSGGK